MGDEWGRAVGEAEAEGVGCGGARKKQAKTKASTVGTSAMVRTGQASRGEVGTWTGATDSAARAADGEARALA